MTEPAMPVHEDGSDALPAVAPTRRTLPPDVRVALQFAVGLSVLGAVLGLVWAAWSPPGPSAIVFGNGVYQVLEETESMVAGDGRFLVLVVIVGVIAPLLAWFGRPATRGLAVLTGLFGGAAVGGALTDLIGHLTGGGSTSGRLYELSDGTRREVTTHLPLSLHIPGLLLVEPLLIALIYGLLVSFAVHDDLGRPDPVRDALIAADRTALVPPDWTPSTSDLPPPTPTQPAS